MTVIPMVPRVVTGDTSPRVMLERAIADVNAKPVAREAFLQWPITRVTLERLAWYVTDRILFCDTRIANFKSPPLLHVIVRDAFNFYLRARELSENPGSDDSLVCALLQGAFKSVPFLVEVEVTGRDNSRWDPLQGKPLGEFVASQHPITARYDRLAENAKLIHPKIYRTQIAYIIFKENELPQIGRMLPRIVDP